MGKHAQVLPCAFFLMGGSGAAESGTVAPAAVTAGEGLAVEDAVPVLMTRG